MGGKVLELESDKLIEQGLELGRLENQMATAVKMLQVGKYTIEEIADISGIRGTIGGNPEGGSIRWLLLSLWLLMLHSLRKTRR